VLLPVTAQIETVLSGREVLALQKGDVVLLGHSAAEPIAIRVARVPYFEGQLTREGHDVAIVVQRMVGDAPGRMEETAA
jgi:flagellar motor switch protein FliM